MGNLPALLAEPRSRVVLLLVLVAGSWAHHAQAQVIAHPNQIVGEIRFTNTNPEVLALIGPPGNLGPGDLTVTARSRSGPPLTSTTTTSGGALLKTYECTVESGTPGIAYSLTASNPDFRFGGGNTDPVEPEPAPDVRMDLNLCGGILRVHFRWPEGDPASLEVGRVWTSESSRSVGYGATEASLVVHGRATPQNVRISYQIGRDPMHDLFRMEEAFDVIVPCDEIVDVELTCRRPGDCGGNADTGSGLGRIVGNVDVLGVDEVPIFGTSRACTTGVLAWSGPFSNERWDCLQRTPSSGAFELENLLPSDVVDPPDLYTLMATCWLPATHASLLTLRMEDVRVEADQLIDLGDRFVIDPGFVRRRLDLVGPPDIPGRGSSILAEAASHSSFSCRLIGTPDVAPGAARSADGIEAYVHAAVSYDAATESVSAVNDLTVGGFEREAGVFELDDQFVSVSTGSPSSDPMDYADNELVIDDLLQAPRLVSPGASLSIDERYCAGQVNMEFRSIGGTFTNPTLEGAGSFTGGDFEGRPASYEVDRLLATGTPLLSPAPSGLVRVLLPEGHYVLRPSVTSANPGGGTSQTQLPPVEVDVRCRQVTTLSPQLQVALDPLPACASDRVGVSGRVLATMPVERLECSVDGGMPTVLCAPCAASTFAALIDLPPGGGTLVVTATDSEGRTASTAALLPEAREPSALDVRPGSEPLRVTHDGAASITLGWEALGGAPANVYAGSLAALASGRYDHASIGACGLVGTPLVLPMPPAGAYYLVSGSCDWGDGSLGRSSLGHERPAADPRCR